MGGVMQHAHGGYVEIDPVESPDGGHVYRAHSHREVKFFRTRIEAMRWVDDEARDVPCP